MVLTPELLPEEQEQEGGGRCLGRERGDLKWKRGVWEGKTALAASPSSESPSRVPAAPAVPRLRGDLH